ncbi:PAS domain-containing protein [Noviherbaspirillum massiliense]|uniref:PAS domain-containing protein n=1 Tax=Noviherbaspirillum massiliense TaxID=1465823 RepID=UPI0002E680E3|nr:PAS domain-containing protein [Noviherbaspirillum massiliense]
MAHANTSRVTGSASGFLSGGGEMGALLRAHDWTSTPLGHPDTWPATLKTAIRLILTSSHPMFIWWGPDLIQFYNDAYRRTLGPERHPAALGQRGQECWLEIWDIIGPDIELVMSGQGATWREDALVPVTRHGKRENVWWNYGFSPLEDESGVRGILVICSDVTEQHLNRERLVQLNRELDGEVQVRQQAQADLTIERDRIDAALGKSRDDLARQVRDWQRLHDMSSMLLKARTLEDQFDIVLKAVTDFHHCSQGAISLHDPKSNCLVSQASLGLTESGMACLASVPVGAGACGLAFQTMGRVIVEDTETDPVYEPYRDFAREQGIRALYSTPFFSLAGEPLGVLSVYYDTPRRPDERELRLTDICAGQIALFIERARAEQQLHREQERSHRILETMKDGFILLDADFRVVQINAAGLRIEGRPASEMLGRSHWELWPGTEDGPTGKTYKQVMRERQPASVESCYVLRGRETWFDVIAYPHEDGIALLYRDITDYKQTSRELARVMAESERRRRLYETILDNTPDLAYVFDLDHRFTYANAVLLRIWGRTWDEAIGRSFLELGYEPWHAEMHDREIEQAKSTRQPIRGEVPFNGTLGRRIYEYIFVPVLGPDGEVEAIAGTTRDVTERRKAEEALRQESLRKDDFLAMLAHELRNPLAPISAAAELMELAPFDQAQLTSAGQIIARQVRHLTGLVDDLLDVSRVTRGLTTIQPRPLDIKSLVPLAVEQVRSLIESRHHRLILELAAGPAHVSGDRKRLVQILVNLLNNAAKYTPDGGNIRVRMEVDERQVSLSVQDDGIGIAPELQLHVFDLFTQLDRTSDRSQGGLGIGLALVKALTELHGGTIACSSDGPGKGSQFTVSLPKLTERSDPSVDRPPRLPIADDKLRILVVDDNVDAAHMLAMYLQALGHEVFTEHGSKRAFERAKAERPDVCVLDIGLPEIDGNQLARMLRAQGETEKSLLIALTGYDQEQDRLTSLAAGFDHHLVKPVDIPRLNALLAQGRTPRERRA